MWCLSILKARGMTAGIAAALFSCGGGKGGGGGGEGEVVVGEERDGEKVAVGRKRAGGRQRGRGNQGGKVVMVREKRIGGL